jgi:Domain of unknown function (DUF4430)
VSLRRLALPLAVLLLAGCGGQRGHGSARLWITRDRGSSVLFTGRVPAGITALQALDRVAKVKTRYGGRFVQSIDGLSGSLSAERDWFYFVNGIEADRSAAEYRLHPGDLEWWDYRSWRDAISVPIVIGAFPEPFLHGYDGRRRRTIVAYQPGARRAAEAIARVVRGRVVPLRTGLPGNANEVLVHPAVAPSSMAIGRGPTAPVLLSVTPRDALRLARDPSLVRFRYQGVPQ